MPRHALMRWLQRLPMTARLPLALVAVVLVTALGTTQIALQGLLNQVEAQIGRTGQVYLDGMAAGLLPPVMRADTEGMRRALDESLRMHQGLVDRHLFLLDAQGRILARADRAGLPDAPLPAEVVQRPRGARIDTADSSYWVWRPLADERLARGGQPGALTVVANLDLTDYVAERRALWWRVAAFNLAIGLGCAGLGLWVLRRLQRPLDLLTRHLQQTGEAGPAPVPADQVPAGDGETARLLRAYNRMALAAREREALIARMAEQEREAVLGRLAATLAHEVRNPLAGVVTAVDTLRKFGDRPDTREEALDFMERGLRVLGGVVDATLATHRPASEPRAFGPQDLSDLQRLLQPHAQRAGVLLEIDGAPAHELPLAGGEVRQVLLNLMLNAIEASAPGSRVSLHCEPLPDRLLLRVTDEGPGLPAPVADSLERGQPPEQAAGLGVAVVVRLVQRLRGRVAVDAHSGRGTHIRLELPFDDGPAADTDLP
ncbi:sensor histidine kinase [Hydrogenophaga crocea]|uniref:histidine kinase n=1 Tax=Hydrogenophaga crocea TaxID=2716225 RepID=A0A6G8IE72_9BURK|nr:HAMP domain-containing sensor histidine kinase [Hydrogenophaga crocea]QIM51487.1 HAMP domain-containing histidine kinase [Hydrogenophaga crocea]